MTTTAPGVDHIVTQSAPPGYGNTATVYKTVHDTKTISEKVGPVKPPVTVYVTKVATKEVDKTAYKTVTRVRRNSGLGRHCSGMEQLVDDPLACVCNHKGHDCPGYVTYHQGRQGQNGTSSRLACREDLTDLSFRSSRPSLRPLSSPASLRPLFSQARTSLRLSQPLHPLSRRPSWLLACR